MERPATLGGVTGAALVEDGDIGRPASGCDSEPAAGRTPDDGDQGSDAGPVSGVSGSDLEAGQLPGVSGSRHFGPGHAPGISGYERRPATDAERRALASVVRLRILRLCLYESLTNREIAQRLNRNPATTLHHVRTLVDQGFLRAEDPRRGRRGAREIPYQATGRSWTLDLGDGPERDVLVQAFIDEVGRVPSTEVRSTRIGLQLSPEHEAELQSRLGAVIEEFAGRPHDPGGRRLSLFLAIHPEP